MEWYKRNMKKNEGRHRRAKRCEHAHWERQRKIFEFLANMRQSQVLEVKVALEVDKSVAVEDAGQRDCRDSIRVVPNPIVDTKGAPSRVSDPQVKVIQEVQSSKHTSAAHVPMVTLVVSKFEYQVEEKPKSQGLEKVKGGSKMHHVHLCSKFSRRECHVHTLMWCHVDISNFYSHLKGKVRGRIWLVLSHLSSPTSARRCPGYGPMVGTGFGHILNTFYDIFNDFLWDLFLWPTSKTTISSHIKRHP